jgi:hypothetical protein
MRPTDSTAIGQFSFFYRSDEIEKGAQLVRAFPFWFTERHHCGSEINREYQRAIGEWGYYLSEISTVHGKYPGQIDRCLWASLGKSNFLHKLPSDFKSFVLDRSETKPCEESTLFHSIVNASGTEVGLFKMESP